MAAHAQPIWIEAPDSRTAAFLVRESVGWIPMRLIECAGSRWRVVVVQVGTDHPSSVREVIRLVRCWLERMGLPAAALHVGTRTLTVRRAPLRRSSQHDPCRHPFVPIQNR